MKLHAAHLLLTIDLLGTFVFALEGGSAAAMNHLDLFGVLVLGFVTAVGGGIIRDLLIGAVPPASIRDWRYPAIALAGGFVAFVFFEQVQRVPPSLLMYLDAAGLSLFAIAGTTKALNFNMHPLVAALLGTITGTGGGTVRDVLLAHIPIILVADIYASAALAGSVVMLIALRLKMPPAWAAGLGGSVCFLLRVLSVWRNWSLPHIA